MACALCAPCGAAHAWVLVIEPGPRSLFLQIGDGSARADNPRVNLIRGGPSAPRVGDAVPVPLSSDSGQARSSYDGRPVCAPPAQVYIAAAYRRPGASAAHSAQLQVASPPFLSSGDAQLPIGAIAWASADTGNPATHIPSGSFAGGSQALQSVRANRWLEDCLRFTYANAQVLPAGTYRGRVVYQLSAP